MSRKGVKTVIARAIVDKVFRHAAFSDGADLVQAIRDAGYDSNLITDEEIALLSCNSVESFSEPFVDIERFEDFFKISEARFASVLTGREAEAGAIPEAGSAAAIQEGL